MKRLYRDKRWEEFREEIFEMDGYACVICGRERPEVTLQAHHKKYEKGKAPWDYPPEACETLCKGCHAREHGEIRPNEDWELYAQDDLGGLYGTCDCCGTNLRHVFYIQHEKWEPIAVGTNCCDNLTGTTEATEYRKKLGRKKRFLKSKRWKQTPLGIQIKPMKMLEVEVRKDRLGYKIHMNNVKGAKAFETEFEAKEFVFELIENGEAKKFALKHPLEKWHA